MYMVGERGVGGGGVFIFIKIDLKYLRNTLNVYGIKKMMIMSLL